MLVRKEKCRSCGNIYVVTNRKCNSCFNYVTNECFKCHDINHNYKLSEEHGYVNHRYAKVLQQLAVVSILAMTSIQCVYLLGG